MKGFTTGVKWAIAAALLVALTAVPALAGKKYPAKDGNTNVPAVPRAIPELIPYHKFDPPKSKGYDASKLTVSGDMRVRPEFRTNNTFGATQSNVFYVSQLIRLGFNYDISPDVAFFVQPQIASNWGTVAPTGAFNPGGPAASGTQTRFFLRQGFMLVRNFGMKNLTMKAGRQLVVWGNHRIFGHFDWNNVGFAFDGLTFRYNHKSFPVEVGWLVVADSNSPANGGGTVAGKANADANILYVRVPAKIGGIAFEPAFIVESGGVGGTAPHGGQAGDQERYTMGFRAAGKKSIVDVTVEAYYQTGDISFKGAGGRSLDIEAIAFHADGGVTLPVPMQPRLGVEFNYASGDGDAIACNAAGSVAAACNGTVNTFSQLFPTNHIHFGYIDRQAWQNMVHYMANLQLRPTKNSHFDIAGHIHRKAVAGDFWYQANQLAAPGAQVAGGSKNVGKELNVVYTLFFQGNQVGWQTGYGIFFAGKYIDQAQGGGSAPNQSWGYTQLWVNF